MEKFTKLSLLECKPFLRILTVACAALVAPGDLGMYIQAAQAPSDSAAQESQTLSPEQLDSLVAPIALYPDALLAQILAASTYPLQIVEASRWVQNNSSLTGDALVEAAAKQDWDASIQALVVFPDVLSRMDESLKWTTGLGNAFLAQEGDVMAAIQVMRQKAKTAGALNSNSQQKVEITAQQGQKVIVIQPANPQVIYVPSYNPIVVYGPAPIYYPYPVMIYPPPPPAGAVVAASFIAFGVGVALGAAFRGCCAYGGWGWGCNWGGRSITINNTFVGRYRLTPMPYGRVSGTAGWVHNPAYRGAVPYSSAAVAGRYRGAAGVRGPYRAAGAAVGPRGAAVATVGPNGARGAVVTPNGTARGVRTPNGSAAVARNPNGAAAGVRTANASAATISTRNGNASAVKTPYGSAVKTPSGTYTSTGTANRPAPTTQPKNWGGWNNSGSEKSNSGSAFSGSENGKAAQIASNRGASSLKGAANRSSGGREGLGRKP